MHVFEYDEMIAFLQEHKGNQFVYELQQMAQPASRGAREPKEEPRPEEKLLGWDPVDEKGDDGQAAWLLEAVAQGFATAHGETKTQLRALKKAKQGKKTNVESVEVLHKDTNGVKYKRLAKHKDSRGQLQAVYDVEIDDAPILSVLVHLLRDHITGLHSRRVEPEPLFELGTFLRRDAWFKKEGSDHTKGAAIDLGGMDFSSADDVIEILEALPPKAYGAVVPDSSRSCHIGVRDGAYRIGLGFEGEFFPEGLKQGEAKKHAVKGASHDKHPQATWVENYKTDVFTAKADWDETAQKWTWRPKTTKSGVDAFHKLKSQRLKDALLALNPAKVDESTEAEVESTEE
jgi:hypothetical protein